jgi:hypothetical protein
MKKELLKVILCFGMLLTTVSCMQDSVVRENIDEGYLGDVWEITIPEGDKQFIDMMTDTNAKIKMYIIGVSKDQVKFNIILQESSYGIDLSMNVLMDGTELENGTHSFEMIHPDTKRVRFVLNGDSLEIWAYNMYHQEWRIEQTLEAKKVINQ